MDPDNRSIRARLRARPAAAFVASRSRLNAEAGSVLIEVMIGAVVVAIATIALLNGLDGAQATGARNKARSVAAVLAEQDQERMRAMPVTSLAGYSATRTVTVRNVDYTVMSSGGWATDTGGPISCSNNSKTASNIRIVSRGQLARHASGPVDEASLVTPPPGTYATGQGRAIVKVLDRDQAPRAGHHGEPDRRRLLAARRPTRSGARSSRTSRSGTTPRPCPASASGLGRQLAPRASR